MNHRLGMLAPLALVAAVGCQTAPLAPGREAVAAQLVPRFGHTLPDHMPPGQFALPPGVSIDDGLTEDEAIGIALWNNALFQELLTDLGLARGDLIQAGLLPNPEVAYFFGTPDKPFKYAVDLPIEALWLRPIRVKAAAAEAARTADRLSQAGLDLMRDVRQAYADAVLARDRLAVAKKTVELRTENRTLVERLRKKEDVSAQDAATARIQALQADQDAARAEFDVPIAEARLRNLLGMGALRGPLPLAPSAVPQVSGLDPDQLANEAVATRPDAVAAARAVAAAEERLRLARRGWIRFLGTLDATSGRATGHEFAPAFRVTLPILNRNQGAIARAEAELERAVRNRQTVANQIVLDVQRAHLQYKQATAEMDALKTKVRPQVEDAIDLARKGYNDGDTTIFVVLENTRQLLDNYLREAVLAGDLRRAWAELERGVGRRLATLPPEPPPDATVEVPKTPPADPDGKPEPDTKPPPEKNEP